LGKGLCEAEGLSEIPEGAFDARAAKGIAAGKAQVRVEKFGIDQFAQRGTGCGSSQATGDHADSDVGQMKRARWQ
jgi:hypothetical protein